MKLYISCIAAFIVGMGISHFAYKAYKYAQYRWKVPTFDGWDFIHKRGSK